MPSALLGVGGEDVEDDGRAIDDGQPERLLEVALLASGQLVIAGDQVRVGGGGGGPGLEDLAGTEVGVGVRLLALLDHLPHDGYTGGSQQLAQLGEVTAPLRQRRDTEGALSGALNLLHLSTSLEPLEGGSGTSGRR